VTEPSGPSIGQLRRDDGEDDAAAKLRESTALLATEIIDRTTADAARLRLLRRLIVAQEEERRRIARDLHDDVGQWLTALRLSLFALRDKTNGQEALSELTAEALERLVRLDKALDFLAWELRPAALDELTLPQALEHYVAEWSRHAGIAHRFHSALGRADRFAPEIETTVYRIVQEALTNAAKHSQARLVNVVLESRGEHLVLVVEDDGKGHAAGSHNERMLGLSGMQERAAAVGGTVEIEPTPGGGTTVLARIPMAVHLRSDGVSGTPSDASRLPWAGDGGIRSSSSDTVLASLRTRLQELQAAVGARDEFIATVAHELRNPISPLVFQLRLILDRLEEGAKSTSEVSLEWVQSQLRRMDQRLHHVLQTLDRLLDVSRLSTGRIDLQLEPVDLAVVVREVATSLESELAVARCPLSLSAIGDTRGTWDRLRLEQICRNLLSNAIRFGAGQPVVVTVVGRGASVVLTVTDKGVGIAREMHESIFERFERGPGQHSGGFGIGLWVVKSICLALGGNIEVESELGEGATFTVTLPRRDQKGSVDDRSDEA